jgi:hypothetical protein
MPSFGLLAWEPRRSPFPEQAIAMCWSRSRWPRLDCRVQVRIRCRRIGVRLRRPHALDLRSQSRRVHAFAVHSLARVEDLFWYMAASALERRFFMVSGARYSATPIEALTLSLICPDLPSTVWFPHTHSLVRSIWAVALGKAQSNRIMNSSPPQRPMASVERHADLISPANCFNNSSPVKCP